MNDHAFEQLSKEERIETACTVFEELWSEYEDNAHEWFLGIYLSILAGVFKTLRHYVESIDSEINWEQPFIECQYFVEWNWDAWESDEIDGPMLVAGHLESDDTHSLKTVSDKLSSVAWELMHLHVLGTLTNDTAWEISEGLYYPILPGDLEEQLKDLKKKARKKHIQEWLKPYVMGIEIDDGLSGLSQTDMKGLEVFGSISDDELPQIQPVNFLAGLNAAIGPLVIDSDSRRAYFPIYASVLQLDAKSKEIFIEDGVYKPPKWPLEFEQGFWEGLVGEIESLADEYLASLSFSSPDNVNDGTTDAYHASLLLKFSVPDSKTAELLATELQTIISRQGSVHESDFKVRKLSARQSSEVSVDQDVPGTIQSGITRIVWNSRFRFPILIVFFVFILLFAIWASLPEETQLQIIDLFIEMDGTDKP